MPGYSFTTKCNGIARVLQNKVAIESIGLNSPNKNLKWTAVWDTGATGSVITTRVVKELGLQPVSIGRAVTPKGEYESYRYYIDLTLPNRVTVKNLLVMEMVDAVVSCDILIGMDVISQGDFAVTRSEGNTIFSFRMPSCGEIDFVKNTYLLPAKAQPKPGRNELCPCGSGKKYKQCCGK